MSGVALFFAATTAQADYCWMWGLFFLCIWICCIRRRSFDHTCLYRTFCFVLFFFVLIRSFLFRSEGGEVGELGLELGGGWGVCRRLTPGKLGSSVFLWEVCSFSDAGGREALLNVLVPICVSTQHCVCMIHESRGCFRSLDYQNQHIGHSTHSFVKVHFFFLLTSEPVHSTSFQLLKTLSYRVFRAT